MIGDPHCGSTLALCPPGIELIDGGEDEGYVYQLSRLQEWIWRCWLDWCRSIPKGSIGVVDGDTIQGTNIKDGALVSFKHADQILLAVEALKHFCKRCSITYFLFGTEWHEFTSGENAVQVVRDLRREGYNVKGPRQELSLYPGDQFVHIAHHRSVTNSPVGKATPLAKSLAEMLFEAPKRGGRYPNVVVRAHAHDPGYWWSEYGLSIGLPGWQIKTAQVWKKAPASVSSVGGMFLEWENDMWRVTPRVYRLAPSRPIQVQLSKKS